MNNEARQNDKEQRYFVVCKLCDKKFRTITAAHLRTAHAFGVRSRHPVPLYKKMFQVAHSWSYRTLVLQRRSHFKTLQLTGRRRTTCQVIEEIRRMALQGKEMNCSVARETNRRLVHSALLKFKSWGAALRAAGLNTNNIRRQRRWTDAALVNAIHDRRRRDRGMCLSDSRQDEPALVSAACNRFGNWDAALRAAGLDPGRIRKRRKWSRESTIDAIRNLHGRREPVNSHAMQSIDNSLFMTACRQWGGWDKALRAAGLDPAHVRKTHAWMKSKVITEILRRRRRGMPLNAAAVQRSDNALYLAARRRFGSWDSSLRAVGLSPEQIRRSIPWSPKTVVAALRRRWKQGKEMSATALGKTDPRLEAATRSHFQSWRAAMRAAGFDPDRFRKHRTWGKDKIIASIRRRADCGPEHVGYAAVRATDHPLFKATIRMFGGWFPALKAAGLDPDRFRIRTRWTDDKVLKAIRDVHRHCGNATSSALRAAHQGSLLQYIKRRGWTLPQARAMAGLPDAQQKG